MLGNDDIAGKKHSFMAGNFVYYSGDVHGYNETIGLSHPFYHDLRSRGTGIVYHEGVGTGNDFWGWEFWRNTKIAYGTILSDGIRVEAPSASRLFWRPDKVIAEYDISNPYLQGTHRGWCHDWKQGSSDGSDSFWINLTEQECWNHCNNDPLCFQAVYEDVFEGEETSQCWIGLNKMVEPPTDDRCPTCHDTCFAKDIDFSPVYVREEKFISSNDVVSSIMTADRPVTVEFSGRSYGEDKNAIQLKGKCSVDIASNSIRIEEGGTVTAKVMESPEVLKEATLMYDGMNGVLSSSQPLENVTIFEVSPGVCGYSFSLTLDSTPVVISWSMNDDYITALAAVQEVLSSPELYLQEKTDKMNDLLNNVVPYFRCSDEDIVKIYYYLWSLYLMYITPAGKGMRAKSTTQTAVNNFLGLHRYDAVFQILVGSWTPPTLHEEYANGNVLAWSDVLPYRINEQLPDNFGIDWASGVYGPETIAHVIGAFQIYEHSGNLTFLSNAYEFYKELFWEKIGGNHWLYAYDSVLCLNKMAEILGFPEDATHWNTSINMDYLPTLLENNWEKDTPNMWGGTENGIGFTNIAPTGMSMFPREWVDIMAQEWLNDPVKGFLTDVPLSTIALQDWPEHCPEDFAVVPDANWYMLRGLYVHEIGKLANDLTLAHLKKYNMEWGIPSATEGRKKDFSLFGDRYSNFNAGKILLIIEGIGGIKYSMYEDTFQFADNLPSEWDFMEFHIPVNHENSGETKVKLHVERKQIANDEVLKKVTVSSNPFKNLIIQPWTEGAKINKSTPIGADENTSTDHMSWLFVDTETANIELILDSNS